MNQLQEHITDSAFLQTLIPQKPPFVMVSKLLFFSDTKIVSGFTVSPENIFIEAGHLAAPGLIENMAQTVALHTGYKCHLNHQPAPIGYIGAIKKAEVHSLPPIGMELQTSVEILHDIMGITLVASKVECNGQVIATSEMKTALAN
tara:strand:- start:1827 stop:2264 length:438 start_codon:yes stop_codon:yes gene_type:complete